MSLESLFDFTRSRTRAEVEHARTSHVQVQRPLRRVLQFTGRTIDDVVNDPIVRREVLGYYKLHKWVQRESDIFDLERQWNATS
jgi:hypothetical protein